MSTTTDIHPLAAQYLRRLEREARVLPRSTRAELVEDIRAHLAEATTPGMSDAQALTELDRLGDPAEIVRAQQPERAASPTGTRGTQEWAAIFFLLFGGFFVGIGWIFGLILLWTSAAWRTRDKLIGTLLLPGGFAAFLWLGVLEIGTSTSGGSCVGGGAPVSLNGHPVRAAHAPHLVCTSSSGSGPDILGIALWIVLLITPILTAIYLARRAGSPTAATA